MVRKANRVTELEGLWSVERTGGLLPPLVGVRKNIRGTRGETVLAGRMRLPFDVVGNELRYRGALAGFVDVLERVDDHFAGRALFRGTEYARFRLLPVKGERMGTINDQLVKHIDEAIAMEESVKRMLDGMIQTTDDAQIIDVLEHHKLETEQHSQRLRRRLTAHGASPSVVREATGIIGALAKMPLDRVRGDKAGRNARDGYATEHMEIASYELLERVAQRAGDEETAAVARRNRAEEQEMAWTIEANWDKFAALALREAGVAAG